jgi:outer membrane protein assembly factor BamC
LFPMSVRRLQWPVLISCSLLISACSWFSEEEPGAAPVEPPLEVPPDLIKPSGNPSLQMPQVPQASQQKAQPAADLPKLGQRVLPPQRGVTLVRDGWRRWLLVEAEPEQVWPLAKKFLLGRGYLVATEDPEIGFLETKWKQRYAAEGDKGEVKASTRERLRLRLEPGEGLGTTEVFLSQEAAQREGDTWQLRAPDAGRSEEMLNRLARYLGGHDVKQAVPLTPLQTELSHDADGAPELRVSYPFDKTWRRVGLALENLGFVVEDYDRSSNTYHVYNEVSSGKTYEEIHYGKPEKATVRETFRVRLVAAGDTTVISIRDKSGAPESTQQARHLLNLLQGQLQ